MPLSRGKASIIGSEDDDCPLCDSRLLQGREHAADGCIKLLDHCCISWIILDQANPLLTFRAPLVSRGELILALVLGNQVGTGPYRDVDGEERKVGEEGSVPVGCDEPDCRGGNDVGRLGIFPQPQRSWHAVCGIVELPVARKAWTESLSTWRVGAAAKVPLAGEEGGITHIMECFGQGYLLQRQGGAGMALVGAHRFLSHR